MSAAPLLQVEDLSVRFRTRAGTVTALDGLSFALEAGEILALVGASGSGKSTAALAIAGLLDPAAELAGGSIRLRGRELRTLDARGWQAVRRQELAMVFQQPRRALDPVRRIGDQLADALRAREGLRGAAARARVVELLAAMGLDDPEGRLRARPHQLSGGQCQRVLVALALTGRPSLLLADEPTTALDTPTQAAVLALLAAQARSRGMAMLWITHDAALAAQWADRSALLEGGRIVASETRAERLVRPAPFRPAGATAAAEHGGRPECGAPLLAVQGLRKRFGGRTAVDGVDFRLAPGRALGLVGASGAGKSTVAALLVRLLDADGGAAWLAPAADGGSVADGPGGAVDLLAVPAAAAHRAPWRRRVQLVPQDPLDSLDPTARAFDAIALPLERLEGLRGAALAQRVHAAADLARLPRALLERRPHQLSGGQAARVAIARAVAVRPALLVLDEPTSALDAAVREQVLEMLAELQRATGTTCLLIAHDLRLVRQLCDTVAVLERGRIVEHGPVARVFARPQAAATRALLAAMPGGPGGPGGLGGLGGPA